MPPQERFRLSPGAALTPPASVALHSPEATVVMAMRPRTHNSIRRETCPRTAPGMSLLPILATIAYEKWMLPVATSRRWLGMGQPCSVATAVQPRALDLVAPSESLRTIQETSSRPTAAAFWRWSPQRALSRAPLWLDPMLMVSVATQPPVG